LEIIKTIAQDLKRLEEYETLATNEIEAWIRRTIMSRTNNECYATAEDYFASLEQMEIVQKIEEFIKKISD
jgi:Txe/YoeB family toxin of Txe-Axe toxin-antitoxin module